MPPKANDMKSTTQGYELGDTLSALRVLRSLRMNIGPIDVLEVGEPTVIQRGSVAQVDRLTVVDQGILVQFHSRLGMPPSILVPWAGVEFVVAFPARKD